jgi:uridine kinase
MRPVQAFESVSTWRQPGPPPASAVRSALIADVAARVAELAAERLRVAIDGLTCAGKTSFGHELAAALRKLGRPTARASLDDFKNPWCEAREQGYDRLSGEGYYRNAYDFASATGLLLGPAGPGGSGVLVLCAHDPLTGEDHRDTTVATPAGTVLVVDSVFAFRPEYSEFWDYRIWLEVGAAEALRRGIARDAPMEGAAEAERVHRVRYHAAEAIYRTEVDPLLAADLLIDNSDIAAPVILGSRRSHSG